MDAKLTLKLDQEVIEATRRLAARRGVSLSRLVETYFRGLGASQAGAPEAASGVVAELTGIATGADAEGWQDDYAAHLAQRYE